MNSSVVLVQPPGWTLHPGGPHLALPLLKGYLEHHGIEADVMDLNIGVARYYGAVVTEEAAAHCSVSPCKEGMNQVYFEAEDRLHAIARNFGGTWHANEGFKRSDCDLANPDDVLHLSKESSPFTPYFLGEAIPRILSTDPKVIGIGLCVANQLLSTFELVRLLRASGYEGFIVLGGNTITRIAGDMVLDEVFELIDGLSILQGEETFLELVRALERGSDLSCVPNLYWKSASRIVRNKKRSLSPSQFLNPSFDGLDLSKYWGTPYLPAIGARGCYYGKCSFCAIPHGWGEKRYIGRSPAEQVHAGMRDGFEKHGVTRFKFVEEALYPKLLTQLSERLIEDKVPYEFEGYVRFDPIWTERSFLEPLARAGFRKAYLGLELAPSDTRSQLTKNDNGDPVELLKLMKDLGIKTHIFCLFGFPGTGVDDAIRTIDFALRYEDYIDTLDVFPFYYARHTSVQGAKIVLEPERSWAVEHRYVPDGEDVLNPEEVKIVTDELSEILWSEHPEWLHPVYRMYSPWGAAIESYDLVVNG